MQYSNSDLNHSQIECKFPNSSLPLASAGKYNTRGLEKDQDQCCQIL